MLTIYMCSAENSCNNRKGLTGHELKTKKKVKSKLETMQCKVIDPKDLGCIYKDWTDELHYKIEMLKQSNAIYVLPNWKESIMARILLTAAMDMKLYTFFHPVSNKEIKRVITTLDN